MREREITRGRERERDRAGKSLYRGKVTIPLVQSSTNCRVGCWWIEKYFLLFVNSQAHSWLTTAHAVPSPSPCIEISLDREKEKKKRASKREKLPIAFVREKV